MTARTLLKGSIAKKNGLMKCVQKALHFDDVADCVGEPLFAFRAGGHLPAPKATSFHSRIQKSETVKRAISASFASTMMIASKSTV
jgi:hypothetical protein